MDPVVLTTGVVSVTSTVAGSIALYIKHLREKRERQTEQIELDHLKERIKRLEEKCASMGDLQNTKKDLDELKDTIEKLDAEKRQDVQRIYDRLEKLYEKVLEWLAKK